MAQNIQSTVRTRNPLKKPVADVARTRNSRTVGARPRVVTYMLEHTLWPTTKGAHTAVFFVQRPYAESVGKKRKAIRKPKSRDTSREKTRPVSQSPGQVVRRCSGATKVGAIKGAVFGN